MSTVRIVRITHPSYADEAYAGKGGLYAHGRWHSQGRLVCYASESLALATIEQIGRVGTLARLKEMVYVPATLEMAAVLAPTEGEFPPGWNKRPPGRASRDHGNAWLAAAESVGLRVPSVILPEGFNYVLSVSHPDFNRAVSVGEPRALDLDPRIVERLRLPPEAS